MKYLAQSNSQIKEKSFWFMESQFDKESVIKDYGDFSNEKVGLRKLARIG